MHPAAFIFDLDGTLVDTERLWAEAIRDYLAACQTVCGRDQVLQIVFGRSWLDIHADLHALFPEAVPPSARKMAEELRPYYLRLRRDGENIVIADSVETLKRLAETAPVIIVSGSPHNDVEEAVDLIGVREAVRFVLGAEDYARGKPAPDGFLEGAARLGVPPGRCVVFEDSPAGVAAAKTAGMMCIALDRTGLRSQALRQADLIVPRLGLFDPERAEGG